MWKHHRIMDLLLIAVLLPCFVLSASGSGTTQYSVEVQNILNNFDALIKLKSTVPTVSSRVCVVSVDELNEIEKAIIHNVPAPIDADVSITFSSSCTKLDRVKTEILKLKNHVAIMVAAPVCSHKYRTLKVTLESKISQLKTLLDDTKKVEAGARLDLLVKLQTEFLSLHPKIIEVLTKLEADQKRVNDANYQIAIDHLRQGKLDEAVAAYALITDHEIRIEQAVKSTYGNGDNFENICRFVLRSPLHSKEIGYKALREHLKKDSRSDERIWFMAAEIHHIPEKDRGALQNVMVDIKTLIRNNKLDGLVVLLNKPVCYDAMKDFVPSVVRAIYEETDKSGVKNFLAVLKKIPTVHHKLDLINELVKMLKSTGRLHGKDMFLIVYELIKLRKEKGTENKVLQLTIEQNLPAQLRDLMYKDLCIKNAENGEYLFTNPEIVEEQERPIHTAKTQLNETFQWQIYFIEEGQKIQIRDNKHGRPLYLIEEGNPEDEHVLSIGMPVRTGAKTAEFDLDLLSTGEFVIVNKYYGQVLYSPFNHEPNTIPNRRPIFSKTYEPNNIKLDSKWIIGVCKIDVEYVF